MLSAAALRYVTCPARSVLRYGVADGVEGHFGAFSFTKQGLGCRLAVNHVAERILQGMTVELRLQQIALRTAHYGLPGERFVARFADDQDGDVGCGPPELIEGLESLAIGQEQVEQHSVYLSRVQLFDALGEVRHPFDREGSVVCRERGSNRFGVGRISLDQQDPLVHSIADDYRQLISGCAVQNWTIRGRQAVRQPERRRLCN